MKKMMVVVLAIVMLAGVGCSTTDGGFSMNYQRSLARSGGDIGSTALLQQTPIEAAKIIEVADDIDKLIGKANLDAMTKAEITALISSAIKYAPLKNVAISIVNKIPDGMSGESAKKVIMAFTKGMRSGATDFDPAEK